MEYMYLSQQGRKGEKGLTKEVIEVYRKLAKVKAKGAKEALQFIGANFNLS